MIIDQTNKFSAAQAFTATAVSENVIDLGVANRDPGVGEVIPVNITVDAAFTGLTSVQVSVQTANNENFSDAVDVIQTPAVAQAELVAGYTFNIIHMPKGVLRRYVRLNYTVVGVGTGGTLTAAVVAGNQLNG